MTTLLPDLPQTETAIIELTNAFRRENKLAEVAAEPTLTKAAREYAAFLAASKLFSHTADGRRPADRTKAAGYAFCEVAENLASLLDSRGFETRTLAQNSVEGWKNSPPHRRAMLAPHVTEIGVAIAKAKGEEKYLLVQMFARPQALKYVVKIDNRSGSPVAYRFGAEQLDIKSDYVVEHTACQPAEISFRFAGGLLPAIQARSRYEARDGQVYTLTKGPDGKLRVDVQSKAAN